MPTSRRSFLKQATATAVAAPFILPSHIWAADAKPNSRLGMGFVGMGRQSGLDPKKKRVGGLLGNFLGQDTRVLAVCDVDTTRRNEAKRCVDEYYGKQQGHSGQCATYSDFRQLIDRKDIDAVCIATPDHWHTIVTLAALRSGKDVYCEKPLTHNIHESVEVLRAVDANHRVLQTGSMQRSSTEFRVACELVRNGVIGKIERVECSFGGPSRPCNLPEQKMEPGLDWDMWLGPAPQRPYHSDLSPRGICEHFPSWRNYCEFGTGGVGDWGAHHLDIAQWGLGMDDSGPVEVLAAPKATDTHGAKLVYANGVTVEHKSGGIGVNFFGSEGIVRVDRGLFSLEIGGKTIADHTDRNDKKHSCQAEVQKAARAFLQDPKIKLYVSKNHVSDFMQCVESRSKPITSEQVGARSAICCHLLNIVYHHHQNVKWDPAKFVFAGDTGNPKWLTSDYRSPWSV
jgi:predicted dehydrogenase